MRVLASLIFVLAILIGPAEARPHRPVPDCPVLASCGAGLPAGDWFLTGGADSGPVGPKFRPSRAMNSGPQAQIVGHPPGCPRTRFCGCGAAVRVFGTPRRDLWLAANWLRFPRAAPAPGMVAARRGHVFVLESHVSGNTWIVYDANSGGRRTRIHARSLGGYTVVNPRA